MKSSKATFSSLSHRHTLKVKPSHYELPIRLNCEAKTPLAVARTLANLVAELRQICGADIRFEGYHNAKETVASKMSLTSAAKYHAQTTCVCSLSLAPEWDFERRIVAVAEFTETLQRFAEQKQVHIGRGTYTVEDLESPRGELSERIAQIVSKNKALLQAKRIELRFQNMELHVHGPDMAECVLKAKVWYTQKD